MRAHSRRTASWNYGVYVVGFLVAGGILEETYAVNINPSTSISKNLHDLILDTTRFMNFKYVSLSHYKALIS